MLGNCVCWAIALGLMFSRSEGFTSDIYKILLAMGFILLAILNKAVEVYQVTHTPEDDEKKNT